MKLIGDIEFWKLIVELIWPLVFLVVFFSLRQSILSLFKRDSLTIKIAGQELNVKNATANLGTQVADLQAKVASLGEGEVVLPTDEPSIPITIEKKSKVLLWVDDFPSNNAFLIEELRDNSVEVVLSLGTSDAISKISQIEPDLIISDLGRIENNIDNPLAGMELLQVVRMNDREIPFLIYAGRRGLENRKKLMSLGATGVTSSGVDVMRFVDGKLSR